MSASEATAGNRPRAGSKNFYFLQNKRPSNSKLGEADAAKSEGQHGTFEVEMNGPNSTVMSRESPAISSYSNWIASMNPFSSGSGNRNGYQALDTHRKPRKVPVKVEPKVFFANERTFLAWIHMSVTLASISVAIVAFAEANAWSQVYGLLLMPASIAFCCYSLYIYMKRSAMIRRRDPGPYEDVVGPTVLAAMLGLTILVNFCVKLYNYGT